MREKLYENSRPQNIKYGIFEHRIQPQQNNKITFTSCNPVFPEMCDSCADSKDGPDASQICTYLGFFQA